MERDYRKHSSIVHSQLAAKHLFADILEKRFHQENTTSKYESKGLVHFKPVPLSPKNVRTSTVPPHQSR